MQSEVPHSLRLQNTVCLKQLFLCHAILGIAGVIHDSVAHGKNSTRVVAAAHRFREFAAEHPIHGIDHGDVIEVNDAAEFGCQSELLIRRIVGRKHDVIAVCPYGIRQQELRVARAVKSAVIFPQNIHEIRIWRRLDRKEFTKARVPGKGFLHGSGILPDSLLIIEIKRRRIFCRDLFDLLPGHKRNFLHDVSLLRRAPRRT